MSELSVTRAMGVDSVRPVGAERTARVQAHADGPPRRPSKNDRPERDRADVVQNDLGVKSYAKFSFHEKTGVISIKIVNAKTDEVIREIPPEQVVRMAEELHARARRSARGIDATKSEGIDRYV